MRFLGRVSNDDLPRLYGCADVFTMPCRTRWGGLEQEGFGIVFVEAAACGVPQVAGQSGGAAEAVVDGVTGHVVARPDELGARWPTPSRTCSTTRRCRAAMGAASRERAVAEFSYDVLADRLGRSLGVFGVTGPIAIVRADAAGTVVFVVTAALAAALLHHRAAVARRRDGARALRRRRVRFLWAYVARRRRSRTDEISVTSLFLLTGAATPRRVRAAMNGLLAAQVVIATATTFARLDGPDGNPGSSLAVGFLVPMFGFGMNGLWAARHGTFGPRPRRRRRLRRGAIRGESAVAAGAIGQNDDHG